MEPRAQKNSGHLMLAMVTVAFAVALSACSSSKAGMPKAKVISHTDGRGIPAIDEMIVELKRDYIQECYMPVVEKEVPETQCQTELFQLLERRYRTNYNKAHVDMASDDLFFRSVDAKIRRLVRTDAEIRDAVRIQFTSHDELLSYYKSLYGFHPVTSASNSL